MTLLALRPRVKRSFECLYRRHVADVYRYALALLRNPRAAEAVTQTTFLKAYADFRRGERPREPRAWLIAIAHDACRERLAQSDGSPAGGAVDGDGAAAFDDEIASARDLDQALAQLPFSQRLALVMRDLEGRSYAEIAGALALTTSTAETLVFRARRALQQEVGGPLTCGQVELAVCRHLDGRLPRADGAALRAHLRGCPACVAFARRQSAHRAAIRSLASIPLPASLSSFSDKGARASTPSSAPVANG